MITETLKVNLWQQLAHDYVVPHAKNEDPNALLPEKAEIVLIQSKDSYDSNLTDSVDTFFNEFRPSPGTLGLLYDSGKDGLTAKGLSYTLGTTKAIAEKIANEGELNSDGVTNPGELEGIFKAMDDNLNGTVDAAERKTYLNQYA